GDDSRDRGINVRGRFDRLDYGARLTQRKGTATLGNLHKDQVAECVLGVIGNSDLDRAVLQGPHPLVRLGELEVGRNITHRVYSVFESWPGRSPYSDHRLAEP